MPIPAHQRQYLYRMHYSEQPDGWIVDAAQVLWNGEPLNAWTEIKGFYASEAEALARAIECCEAVVATVALTAWWANRPRLQHLLAHIRRCESSNAGEGLGREMCWLLATGQRRR